MGGFTTSKPITLASKFDLNEADLGLTRQIRLAQKSPSSLPVPFIFAWTDPELFAWSHQKTGCGTTGRRRLVPLMKHIERSDRTPLEKRRIHLIGYGWRLPLDLSEHKERQDIADFAGYLYPKDRPDAYTADELAICTPPHRAKVRALPLAAVANALNALRQWPVIGFSNTPGRQGTPPSASHVPRGSCPN